tara:strand:+ start:248 stop:550 length:303 start_codon:yes stop_codon:yes gene_type:complete
MTFTQQFVNKFIILVDIKKEYTLTELKKILINAYNDTILENKSEGKRKPTPYNIFVKKHYPILHKKYPFLNRGLIMRQCGIMWRTAKSEGINAFEWDFYS